jgi:hypothetical protein
VDILVIHKKGLFMDLDDDELRATRKFFFEKRNNYYIAVPEKELEFIKERFIKLKKENRKLKDTIQKMKGE